MIFYGSLSYKLYQFSEKQKLRDIEISVKVFNKRIDRNCLMSIFLEI